MANTAHALRSILPAPAPPPRRARRLPPASIFFLPLEDLPKLGRSLRRENLTGGSRSVWAGLRARLRHGELIFVRYQRRGHFPVAVMLQRADALRAIETRFDLTERPQYFAMFFSDTYGRLVQTTGR